jgi:hypothetical protein
MRIGLINDWKCVVTNHNTKINRFNSDCRSWCWIGDGACIRPQHVHQTMKHGGGLVII